MKYTTNGIGLLGGTFNPIHYGHFKMASRVLHALNLERIIFIPSAHPPHKKEDGLPSPQDRYEMVKLAIKNEPRFSISDIELRRKGKSWTIDTVHLFKKIYPETQIYFIIGADSVPEISTWKNYKKLLNMCNFVVVNRPGYSSAEARPRLNTAGDKLPRYKGDKPPRYSKDFIKVKMRGVNISSTEIRKRAKNGRTIKYLVPEKVKKYIEEKGLYQ